MQPSLTALLAVLGYGAATVAAIMAGLWVVRALRLHEPRRLAAAGLATLAGLLAPTHLIMGKPFAEPPGWLAGALGLIIYLLPVLGIGLAAALLVAGMRQRDAGMRQRENGGGSGLSMLLLSGLLLLKVLHNLHGLLAWDQVYDPLQAIYLVLPLFAALLGGFAVAAELRGPRRLVGLAFLFVLPALLYAIQVDTARIDIYARSEDNARKMAQAVEAYRAREGRYPTALEELSPLYGLAHPRPWIFYGLDWCYQGDSVGYRLGYLFREHWSSPELQVRVAGEAGDLPEGDAPGGALCTEQVEAFLQSDFPYRLVSETGER